MTGVSNHQAGPPMRVLDWFILVSVGLLSSAWCLTAAQQLGPTFDEPLYILKASITGAPVTAVNSSWAV